MKEVVQDRTAAILTSGTLVSVVLEQLPHDHHTYIVEVSTEGGRQFLQETAEAATISIQGLG
jgi:hypothetical protein